eukprot:ctg_1239.g350
MLQHRGGGGGQDGSKRFGGLAGQPGGQPGLGPHARLMGEHHQRHVGEHGAVEQGVQDAVRDERRQAVVPQSF